MEAQCKILQTTIRIDSHESAFRLNCTPETPNRNPEMVIPKFSNIEQCTNTFRDTKFDDFLSHSSQNVENTKITHTIKKMRQLKFPINMTIKKKSSQFPSKELKIKTRNKASSKKRLPAHNDDLKNMSFLNSKIRSAINSPLKIPNNPTPNPPVSKIYTSQTPLHLTLKDSSKSPDRSFVTHIKPLYSQTNSPLLKSFFNYHYKNQKAKKIRKAAKGLLENEPKFDDKMAKRENQKQNMSAICGSFSKPSSPINNFPGDTQEDLKNGNESIMVKNPEWKPIKGRMINIKAIKKMLNQNRLKKIIQKAHFHRGRSNKSVDKQLQSQFQSTTTNFEESYPKFQKLLQTDSKISPRSILPDLK
ncbi:unnamed protein product [Moneuplotes crassus]|uniref:Uncharacterized protein n=1 Tax=Euplotes crassus TaxID=5936 RepID=A0AAD1UMX8_EUPCR|nr:unnamed protein product [Moneuplotes crassus]